MEQQGSRLADMAIWVGTSEKGTDYMVLRAGDDRYVAFYNSRKQKENQPDWRIFKDAGENSLEDVGAAWEKTTKDGKDMLFIKIADGSQERIFRGYVNSKKGENDKKPDLIAFEDTGENEVKEKVDEVNEEEVAEVAAKPTSKFSRKNRSR